MAPRECAPWPVGTRTGGFFSLHRLGLDGGLHSGTLQAHGRASHREEDGGVNAEVTIRLAREGDIAAFRTIEESAAGLFVDYGLAELFASMPTPGESIREGLHNGRLWTAEAGGRQVGFALAGVVGEHAHLEELDVLPEFGRRGIGKALIETVFAWARGAGFSAITLTTMRNVPWNAPFYERMGFRVLRPEELTEPLREILRAEIGRGIPAENRVAMMKRFESNEPA